MKKRRFVIAGTGGRGLCFAKSLVEDFTDTAELVALYDRNPLRMKGFCDLLEKKIPAYTDFPKMVAEAKPTHLIITTPDATHHRFIELAFCNGLDAITEKPMTIDAEKVRFIMALEKKYKRKVIVTFNYRFVPYAARIKELIMAGRLGKILSISMEWKLDHLHGEEYFRRWHSNIKMSGGLLVHKATHHFDIVNWLIEDEPEEVAAFGALKVYGKNGQVRGQRCSTCPHAGGKCHYAMKVHLVKSDKAIYDKLYWEAEAGDGYIRDQCIFNKKIDIYDTMNVLVRYKNGAQLSYALNAYAPVAGYTLFITGTKARLEASESHGGIEMIPTEKNIKKIRFLTGTNRSDIKIKEYRVPVDASAHGGGDGRLCQHLFGRAIPDPLNQMADSKAGAMSCLIGIAANHSIKERRIVSIKELLKG